MANHRAREVVDRAKEAGATTVNAVGTGVRKGLASAKAGMDRASEHVEAEQQRWRTRAERTDMPGIGTDDPLGDLAVRLDRQADFFREIAVDAMRPGMVRGAMVALVITLGAVTAALGLLACWRVLIGGGAIDGLPAVAGAVALAGLAAAAAGWAVERGRAAVAHEALARAEQAEARLCRVAELIGLEKHDRGALVEALRARASEPEHGRR
ncbi:MAG: hypothetical protein ACK5U8_12240 [Deltaproteobacteria bacterium]|jgi:hypothetical protein